MSRRVDERVPTRVNLDVYAKCIKLTDHTMSVCKVKDGKTNKRHIVKRQLKLGQLLIDLVVDIGADILEANAKSEQTKLGIDKKGLYGEALTLVRDAYSLTFRMEHIVRVLHTNRPFADSTITYWMELLVETRELLEKWTLLLVNSIDCL